MIQTQAQFDVGAMLARAGITVVDVSVLASRETKQVARVVTDAGDTLAVKVSTDTSSLAVEPQNNEVLAQIGVPTPEVIDLFDIAIEDSMAAVLVMKWVRGDGLSSSASPEAQREAGRLLRRIHELGGSAPYHGGNTSYAAWMGGWLNVALTWWSNHTSPGDIASAWDWFDQLAPLLDSRGHERVLFDGRPEHFIVGDDRIVGIIDLADLTSGDAAMDLGVIGVNDPALLAGVMEGYEPTTDEQGVFTDLVPFYKFLRALAAAEWNLTHGDRRLVTPMLERATLTLLHRGRC